MRKYMKALAVLLAMLLCLPGSYTNAYAAGSDTYEAEDAKIEGTYQTLDWTTFTNVDVNPVEENANASGGKNVGFFSTVGNSITWTVNADTAGPADLTFVLASCVNNYDMTTWAFSGHGELVLDGHLEISVNGTVLDTTGKVVPAKAGATEATYDYYQGVVFEGVALNAGANTVTIKVIGLGASGSESANVDCLIVSAAGTGNSGNTGAAGGAVPTAVYEAEAADVVADLSAMSWMGVTSAVETKESASGGQSLGYFAAVGNKVTWTVDGGTGGNAILNFVLASGAMDMTTFQNCDMLLDGMVKLSVNGTELSYSGITLPGGPNYDNWQNVSFDVTLNAGSNTVVLEVIDATYGVNIDCLKVEGSGAAGGNSGNAGGVAKTVVYEAEGADVVADLSAMSWMGITTAVETKESASGGQSLGYFGAVGNKVTWTVDGGAGGDATLTFVLASGAMDMATYQNCDMLLDGMVKLTLNGTELSYSNVNLPAGPNYDNWQEVSFDVTLTAGNNTVVLEVIDATYGVNIDCLKVHGTGIGGTPSGSGSGTVSGGSGTLRIEAENADVVIDLSAMSWMGVTSAVESKESASNGQNIGYFGTPGNKVTWKFNASAAGKATLVFGLASGASDQTTFSNVDMELAGNAKLLVNGTELDVSGITLIGGSANYDNWTELTYEVEIQAGANEVVIEIIGSVAPNVDYLEVRSDAVTFTSTQAGGSQGGNNQGGNNQGGTWPGGTTEDGTSGDITTNLPMTEKKPEQTVQTVEKDLLTAVKDSCIGIVIACVVALIAAAVGFVVYVKVKLTEEERKALEEALQKAKERKADWKKEYAKLTDAEEKEISRVKFSLDEKAVKAARAAEIEEMKYGEGVRAMRVVKLSDMKLAKAKYILPLLLVAALIGGVIGAGYVGKDNKMVYASEAAGGEYTLVVEGYDWGPAASKVVLKLDGKVKPEHLAKVKFDVTVDYQGWFGASSGTRTVTDMYLSDANGNKTEKKSEYITLEMEVGPTLSESAPFHYDFTTGTNNWANPYSHTIKLAAGAELVVDGKIYTTATIKKEAGKISPDADVFNTYSGEFEGITLSYAAYEPESLTKDKEKNALIIWLHGAGEGGTDPYINILGNRVTALAQEEVQSFFNGNGAYVLAPQTPTMWMNDGSGEYTTGGTSMYTKSLMALIDAYVKAHEDIDTNRIIVGGCSNGGFMTMNMIMTYPDYFAAAYPVCEAYADEWITDDMLKKITGLPIWFTHAKSDNTVNSEEYTVKTYQRLLGLGANNIHFSYFDKVEDLSGLYKGTTGGAYEYDGHWSWIYTLNNDCKNDFDGSAVTLNGKEVAIWEWLAAQTK